MPRRVGPLLGSFVFFWIAPAVVAGWVPWWLTRWQMQPPFLGVLAGRWLGWALIAAGAGVVLESFARFALQGLGTPAPVAPPQLLVVSGLYRYMRNPMYGGVLAAVLGQAFLLGSTALLEYAAFLWLAFSAFVILYEEPTLERTFGESYRNYRAHVRRWWPRVTPWKG